MLSSSSQKAPCPRGQRRNCFTKQVWSKLFFPRLLCFCTSILFYAYAKKPWDVLDGAASPSRGHAKPVISVTSKHDSLPAPPEGKPVSRAALQLLGVWVKRQINTRHINNHEAQHPVNIKSNFSVTIWNHRILRLLKELPEKQALKALDFYLWNAETDAGLMWFPSLHCAIHSLHYKDIMRSHPQILSPFRHSDP